MQLAGDWWREIVDYQKQAKEKEVIRMVEMNEKDESSDMEKESNMEDKLDEALEQIDMLYKSRCVQPPSGNSNVTIKEINKDNESSS